MPTRSDLLQRRLVEFGVSASTLCRRLSHDASTSHLSRQLAKAAVSPAAQYAEARDAESSLDYVHKLKIAVKELREAAIWLEMVKRVALLDYGVDAVRDECGQLTAILVTCIKKARAGEKAGASSEG